VIVGGGLIAKAFSKKYENDDSVIIFASGVSNSEENNISNFTRERNLLSHFLCKYPNLKFIYFSTILIDYKHNPYYTHKKEMEDLIKGNSKNYLIVRVPQLIGVSGNNNNLINYLITNIKNGINIDVYGDVKRALLDVGDLVNFIGYCKDLSTCKSISVGGVEPISVVDLSKKIGYILNVEPIIKIKVKNEDDGWTKISDSTFNNFLIINKIKSEGYTEKIIKKYIKI
tara:strand:+ start:1061 stop:1744 length:684 start_codon:yes stop_codon:yes gene_type:complete